MNSQRTLGLLVALASLQSTGGLPFDRPPVRPRHSYKQINHRKGKCRRRRGRR